MQQGKDGSKLPKTKKIVYSSSPYSSTQPGYERGWLVFFEWVKRQRENAAAMCDQCISRTFGYHGGGTWIHVVCN
ncbi:hypothetical protein ACFX13_038663 [Malus domestica]